MGTTNLRFFKDETLGFIMGYFKFRQKSLFQLGLDAAQDKLREKKAINYTHTEQAIIMIYTAEKVGANQL